MMVVVVAAIAVMVMAMVEAVMVMVVALRAAVMVMVAAVMVVAVVVVLTVVVEHMWDPQPLCPPLPGLGTGSPSGAQPPPAVTPSSLLPSCRLSTFQPVPAAGCVLNAPMKTWRQSPPQARLLHRADVSWGRSPARGSCGLSGGCCSDGAFCVQAAAGEFAKQVLNPLLTFPVSFDKAEVSRKVATMGKGRWPSIN